MISVDYKQLPSFSSEFYVTGGTVPRDAPCYVHRKADDDLYERLSAGDFCYVLTARQLGKSSLMVRTASRLREDGSLCIILDLTAIGHNVDVSHWYAGLANQLGQHAGIEDEIDDFWLAPSPLGPMQRWMLALQQIVLKRTTGRVVVFVDEIDAVRSLPFSADEFFAGIRECYNRRTTDPELHRLSFCLLGVATPSDLIKDTRITPFNIGSRIELTDFTSREANQLIAGLVDRWPNTTPDDIDTILDRVLYWSGGHPYLTQRLFRAIAERPSRVTASDVDSICGDLFFSSRSRERDDNLHFVRERILRSEADTFALLELYRKVRAGRNIHDDEANRLINVLRLSGIIQIVNGRLLVRNRIYFNVFDLAWIADNMPDAEVRRQRIAYRRGVVRTTAVAGSITLAMTMMALYAGFQKRVADRNAAIAIRNESAAQLAAAQANANAALATRNAGERDIALKEALKTRQAAVSSAAAAHVQAERAKQMEERALTLAHRASSAELSAQQAARMARAEAEMKARYLYIADLSLLGQTWNLSTGVPMDRVNEILSETSKSNARGFEWGYWNRLAHRYQASFEPNAGWIYSADFSPDGTKVATGGDDGTIRLWDINARRCVKSLHPGQNIQGVAYSHDGRHLVTASNTGRIQIWDCNTDDPLRTMKLDYFASKAIFMVNDTRILSWGHNNSAILWDAYTGAKIASLTGHTANVTDAIYCSSTGSVFTGSADGSVMQWNASTGAFEKTVITGNHEITSISANASGTMLTVANGRIVSLVEAKTGRSRVVFPDGNGVVAAAISPDGKSVAIADYNGVITIRNAESLATIRDLHGHVGRVFSVCFSHDGRTLCSAGEDGTARVWSLDLKPDVGLLRDGANRPSTASWSPDGTRIAVGYANGRVGIWLESSGKSVFNRPLHESAVSAVGWNHDGSQFISCDQSGSVITSTAATGEPVKSLNVSIPQTGSIVSETLSSDGRYFFASYADDSVRCWELATDRKVLEIPGNQGGKTRAAFIRDSRFVVIGSHHQLSLWDLSRGALIKVWPNNALYLPSAMDVSRDGKHIVTLNGWSATIFSIDASGLTRERVLRGQMANAYNVAFSPDGSRVISCGPNAAVRLWDTKTGHELLNIHNNYGSTIASFSPDGTKIEAPCSAGLAIWYGTGK